MAAEAVTVLVRYEDEALAIVSKPAGLVAHSAPGITGPTLVDELARRWPENHAFDHVRYGLVHRLDKETSGLLLVARSVESLAALKELFATRAVTKRYLAVVKGVPKERRGVIAAPVGRHASQRTKMAVTPAGKEATTRYEVTSENGTYAVLNVWITSGRTHQIRVHLAALGHPLVGEATYAEGSGRHLLHASELSFTHPVSRELLTVTDEPAADIVAFLRREKLNA